MCCREAREKEKESVRGIPRRGLIEEGGRPKSRGGLSYERGGDALRKFEMNPLKETNLRVAQPF